MLVDVMTTIKDGFLGLNNKSKESFGHEWKYCCSVLYLWSGIDCWGYCFHWKNSQEDFLILNFAMQKLMLRLKYFLSSTCGYRTYFPSLDY